MQSSSELLSSLDACGTVDMSEIESVLTPGGHLSRGCPATRWRGSEGVRSAFALGLSVAYVYELWDPLDRDSSGVVRHVYAFEKKPRRNSQVSTRRLLPGALEQYLM